MIKYTTTRAVPIAVRKKAVCGENLYHIIPANELANKVDKLLRPENTPNALPVSSFAQTLLIQARLMPSVLAINTP